MTDVEMREPTLRSLQEPVPMVDLRRQYHRLKGEIDEAIAEVVSTTRFIKGPVVSAFEAELAGYLGGRHALGVGNGTDALQIALMALGIGPGDEVITPAFSFVAAAETVALLGARPIFAEIDPVTFNIDLDHAETLITDHTAAIIPVHLYGQAADMDRTMELARKHDLYVIEDNAQAIGAKWSDRLTGFIGHIGCLSFFPSKNLGCFGDGGAVLTNDSQLHARMTELANHGAKRKYRNDRVGVNSRLDAIQAAVLRVKLRHLDEFTEARQLAAGRYERLLADVPGIVTPRTTESATHVFHQYTVRLEGAEARTRDALADFLKERGVATAVYYPAPIYRFDAYADGLTDAAPLEHTERATSEVISLPMHTELNLELQTRVVSEIRTFVAEHRHDR